MASHRLVTRQLIPRSIEDVFAFRQFARMPRRLTPLDEGLRTYLGATGATGSSLVFDGPPEPGGRLRPLAGSSAR